MKFRPDRKTLYIICIGGVMAVAVFISIMSHRHVYLYAWERPEDFNFLDKNSNTSVVFYAGDIVIKDGKAVTTLRRNSLFIPNGIESFPLVRIDSFDLPSNLEINMETMTKFITKICGPFKNCQIDFEARNSEYSFYIKLLDKVKGIIPNTKIYITALASWCSGDTWLTKVPINTAIPMLYRMGKDTNMIKSGEVGTWFLSNSKCSDNIALSADELDFNPRQYMRGKSTYLFNPEPWTKDSYKKILDYLEI